MQHPFRPVVGRRAWRYGAVVAIAVAAVVSGCGPELLLSSGSDAETLHQQAEAALARWADAVAGAGGQHGVMLVGELTGQIGDWEPAVGDNNKRALMAGLIEVAMSLPAGKPADGELRWQGGESETVPLVPAPQAVAAIRTGAAGSPCQECTTLRITGARLTTGPVETSRGPATAPIWEFTLEGTSVRVTRVAVADLVSVVPPPWNADHPPSGISVDSASGTVDGRELTVTFVGAPRSGDQACGADYTAEAVESDLALVVIVIAHAHAPAGACTSEGAPRTATVELGAPLGDRAVLEVKEGLPVPVRLAP